MIRESMAKRVTKAELQWELSNLKFAYTTLEQRQINQNGTSDRLRDTLKKAENGEGIWGCIAIVSLMINIIIAAVHFS